MKRQSFFTLVLTGLLWVAQPFLAKALSAKTLQIDVVSDVLQPRETKDIDMALQIFLKLTAQLEQQTLISVKYIPVSRLREWRELSLHPNVCLYNKIKTPERASFAYFAARPMVAFPPHRLITLLPNALPEQLSLSQVIEQYQLKLAAVEGRSYGAKADQVLGRLRHKILWISGKDAESRARQMLLSGKLDAVIEYTATFLTLNGADKKRLSFHKLTEIADISYGYIACARSPQGQRVITMYNDLLALPSNQQMIRDAHKVAFFGQEADFVSKAIFDKLSEPPTEPPF